jgi:lysophospholipid acyltransferase
VVTQKSLERGQAQFCLDWQFTERGLKFTMLDLNSYAESTGMSIGLIRNAVSVLVGIPGFLLFKLVPDRAFAKHWFSIIFTCAVFISIYPWEALLRIVLNSLLVHGLVIYAQGKFWMPWVAFSITMIHLLVHQFLVQYGEQFGYVDGDFVEYAGPLMILVIKLSNYAWACYDGSRKGDQLSVDQATTALEKIPTILSYFGYVFFFGGFFIGPAFEFKDYDSFISKKAPFDHIPSTFWPSTINIMMGFAAFGIYLKSNPQKLVSWALTEEFVKYSLISRYFFSF